MREETITCWGELNLQHLFFAFRKAKSDCYFERAIGVSVNFCEYENEIAPNLGRLLKALHAEELPKLLGKQIDTTRIVAKKLGVTPKEDKVQSHSYFSDPKRAFQHLCASSTLTPEFRVIGDFGVEMHVLSALWINLVGHKYDAVLDKCAYGSRLRRYRAQSSGLLGQYHMEAPASFQPYFEPYKAWRNNGLATIRRDLEAGHGVIAVSMDFASYYHQIDPSFLANEKFLQNSGIELNNWEREFTLAFSNALANWSHQVAKEIDGMSGASESTPKCVVGGLPIGLSISRIASNVLLVGLDRDIETSLTPLYYGRYVDDLLMVLRDPGNLNTASEVVSYIAARSLCFPKTKEEGGAIFLELQGGFQGRTKLELQTNKQKVFFLEGQSGLDLLSTIESQIRNVSSERRLMPSPDNLESMASAQVLTAAGHGNDEVDSLRRADGLSVRRLGWSVQLRAVDTLARDLREGDWHKERVKFYEFAHNHVLRPDKILDHLDYLPRLLSLAVALCDWKEAKELVTAAIDALKELQTCPHTIKVKVNGHEVRNHQHLWGRLSETTLDVARETILRSLRWNSRAGSMYPLDAMARELCQVVQLNNLEEVENQALSLREADWARTAYKDHIRFHAQHYRTELKTECLVHGLYAAESSLREFLKYSHKQRLHKRCHKTNENLDESLLPFLFPTRPYTPQEIAVLTQPVCVSGKESAVKWGTYVNAVGGNWVKGESINIKVDEVGNPWLIGRTELTPSVRLAITSLSTLDSSFEAGAKGRPDRSRGRYERIETIVNDAIKAKPRPTHLLLPELSLPARWVKSVSERLLKAGISLIAGLDYEHHGSSIHSEAVMILTDDRLGYQSSIELRQQKLNPASGEEETLLRIHGLKWSRNLVPEKPVYLHNGFAFGLLICSELQNISYRQFYQGQVDCVMVLAWNKDLETFSALVESASLDVHSYIALVNNRTYGDSRVRSPGKKVHQRDICRLRGGENEHLVIVELDLKSLREFQSRAKNWPRDDDRFKPVPEGYSLAEYREMLPK